jgi:hypothetical protein
MSQNTMPCPYHSSLLLLGAVWMLSNWKLCVYHLRKTRPRTER